jgi:hypothetical protein
VGLGGLNLNLDVTGEPIIDGQKFTFPILLNNIESKRNILITHKSDDEILIFKIVKKIVKM